MARTISWVLLDIGNTLVNDDPAMLMFYRMLHETIRAERPDVEFAQIMQDREALIIARQDTRPWATLAHTYLGREGWHDVRDRFMAENDSRYTHYNPPLPGVKEMLTELSRRYRLAVAANQGLACRPALEELGWLEHFDLVWISDEVGARKPQPEFFTRLLEKAECPAEQAVMIGDRIDADIRPARALGMKAIHALASPGLPMSCDSPEADLYRRSLERVRIGCLPPRDAVETPDAVVRSIAEIPAAVERIQSSTR